MSRWLRLASCLQYREHASEAPAAYSQADQRIAVGVLDFDESKIAVLEEQ